MMSNLKTNVAFWLMLAGISSFVIVHTVFGQLASIEIASGLLLGSLVMLFCSYFLAAAYGVFKGSRDSGAVLNLGICATGLFGTARQIWTWVYRANDRPESMLLHWSYPLILYSCFWAVSVMVLSPGTEAGKIPTPNKLYLVIGAIIGSLAAGIAIGFSFAHGDF